MATSLPTTTPGWELHGSGSGSGANALIWNENQQLPPLGPNDVLVKLHAWAINYPDLAVANGTFPWRESADSVVIPGSDGAGEIIARGTNASKFNVSDKVIVLFYPHFPEGNAPTLHQMRDVPGTNTHGTFRQYAVFNETGLIAMPSTLSYVEAATLPCSALTAWNALHGLTPLKRDDFVLTQGTGGVSLFAVLFALAAGATVIATTSSSEKAEKLKSMGVQHVLNYREDPNWGETARKLTRGELGCHRVIEVGGPQTIKQSFECVARGGEIDVIGFLTGQGHAEDGPTYLEPLMQACMVRGIEVGNHIQFREMNRAIEDGNIKPVVDHRIFGLKELKEAYEYVWGQRQFGKVAI
ncbi:NAD(P)-binding protein, partial [Aspergillus steynii IBT 23096]